MTLILRFVQLLSTVAVIYAALIILNVFFNMMPMLMESVQKGELMPLCSLLITLFIAMVRFTKTL